MKNTEKEKKREQGKKNLLSNIIWLASREPDEELRIKGNEAKTREGRRKEREEGRDREAFKHGIRN